ncbi:MAG: ankyrin repeat domain-containing protein [Candidatus Bathyarchaeota archaeon]|nr:ankyrin repeat domain-containing protein [Candidatus Bathyarchaeota archaeon]
MFKFFKRGKTSHELTKAMITATQTGDVEQVKKLIKKNPRLVNTHQNDKEGFTPLRMATINGHAEVVRVLLAHGANVNARDEKGATPLFWAANRGNAEVMELLLDKGAEIEAQTQEEFTPLTMAASNGHIKVVRVLLAHGANANAQNKFGATPLIMAAMNGHSEVVGLLVEKGADVNAQMQGGSTALQLAEQNRHLKVVELLRSVQAPKAKLVEAESLFQQPVIDQSLAYRLIIETCQKSQETMNRRLNAVGLQGALAEIQPYESMWREYTERITKPVALMRVSFSGLLFKNVKFKNHDFVECDFSGSRWIFSFIENSNCTGSDFSRISAVLCPFRNTNCTNSDFSNAQIHFFGPSNGNNFRNTNFTNAKLNSSHSFFKEEKLISRDIFENAVMNGCSLTIKKENRPQFNITKRKLRSVLEKIFSPDQLAVMHIDYDV